MLAQRLRRSIDPTSKNNVFAEAHWQQTEVSLYSVSGSVYLRIFPTARLGVSGSQKLPVGKMDLRDAVTTQLRIPLVCVPYPHSHANQCE